MKAGSAVALFCICLAVMVWHVPIEGEAATGKGEMARALVNAIFVPVVDAFGREPVVIVLGIIAFFGVLVRLGIGLPQFSMPSIPKPSFTSPDPVPEAISRKRALSGVANLETGSPPPPPPPPPPPLQDQPDTGHSGLLLPLEVRLGERRPTQEELKRAFPAFEGDIPDELVDRAFAMAEERIRKATPHGKRVDPIAIVRKAREKDRDWSGDRSHFGGLPRLGHAEWPRSAKGVPLPFVAQIDLAEVAAANPDTPLPQSGSLAFFINDGAVIHVPEGDFPITPAPHDLPPAYAEDDCPLPEHASHISHQAFPFWPVDLMRLALPQDLPDPCDDYEIIEEIETAQFAALDRLVPGRGYAFTAGSYDQERTAGLDTMWWYGADLLLRQLRTSLAGVPRRIQSQYDSIAASRDYQRRLAAEPQPSAAKIASAEATEENYRSAIPKIEEKGRELADFIGHFEQFVEGRDPWSEMRPEETQILGEAMREVQDNFSEICGFHVAYRMEDLRSASIRRMMTGNHAAVSALPDEVLAYLNGGYRRPSQAMHQMFGVGASPQDGIYAHMSDHLLLQITYDDLPEFRFGDMGVYHFWISPDDLAAGNWHKAELTFECS
ncbi:DUF1963 domain-containing protein [Qipengyuania sp. 1NDH17]|uniref:DUF1963 domain-containing protein n=1 Tax=Qipengyuania polymorpha TaxID=2867234 RepID=A0ABS7J489_9SPHN|nr:DUF1963 domain-containing protein [Qipengyuania polymorpha]MBX7459311.1 DUF1963 domain-containing protein [Qipengyuania polymorpha]